MWKSVGLFRTHEGLQDAVAKLEASYAAHRDALANARADDGDAWKQFSLVTVARLIARAALRRLESRGAPLPRRLSRARRYTLEGSHSRRPHPMKQSKLLIHTYRETPARRGRRQPAADDARRHDPASVAAGIYDYLPLALRSIRKFEHIVREELARDGCQELLMPTVQPRELWEESGRWQFYGKELLRFKDRKDADFCLGPTHEEVVTDIVRKIVTSYKQLPLNVFQIQTKFRDEIRPRFGLMRGREFIMKDGYSFHVDDADADREYWRMFEAYKRIFSRLGVKFRPVEADSGAIGGSFTHEFHVLAGSGEDAILSCNACEYTSNVEKTEAPQLPFAVRVGAGAARCSPRTFIRPASCRWRSRRRRSRTDTRPPRPRVEVLSVSRRRRATQTGTSASCCGAITSRTP